MYCNAAAMLSTKSSWRMVVGMGELLGRADRFGRFPSLPSGVARLVLPRGATAFTRFFAHESAGGSVLALAAAAALVVSNSPLGDAYRSFVDMPGELRIGGDALVLSKPLVVWVNDLWMA